jgi:translation elongation factor EF-Tu-like GTPase
MNADFLAKVSFLTTSEGGRQGPTPNTHFACILSIDGGNHDCRLLLSDCGAIAPGDTATVGVKLLDPDAAKSKLHEGQAFCLREDRVVAHGVVLSVL